MCTPTHRRTHREIHLLLLRFFCFPSSFLSVRACVYVCADVAPRAPILSPPRSLPLSLPLLSLHPAARDDFLCFLKSFSPSNDFLSPGGSLFFVTAVNPLSVDRVTIPELHGAFFADGAILLTSPTDRGV